MGHASSILILLIHVYSLPSPLLGKASMTSPKFLLLHVLQWCSCRRISPWVVSLLMEMSVRKVYGCPPRKHLRGDIKKFTLRIFWSTAWLGTEVPFGDF